MFPISLIIKVTLGFLGIVVVVAGVGAALVYTGTPEPCVDRVVSVSIGDRVEFQTKWDGFKLRSASALASEIFNESQVTAKGVQFLEEEDVDIEDLQVFFCQEGYAEATGTVVIAGPDINFLVRGTLDLSDQFPRIDIEKVQAGNLPGFLRLGGVANSIDDDSKILETSVNLTGIEFSDGEVTIRGAP